MNMINPKVPFSRCVLLQQISMCRLALQRSILPMDHHGSLHCRTLATSAEKRKWKQSSRKQRKKYLLEEVLPEEEKGTDGNPFIFLVVFPVAMTGLVVLFRADLREQLADLGPIRQSQQSKVIEHRDDGKNQGYQGRE